MNLQISGVNTTLTKKQEEYASKKIGLLERYVPQKARDSLKTEVKLKESKARDKSTCVCEVIMHLPHGSVTVHEKAKTMLAAIDLAEDKLKVQLKKYKDKHAGPRLHRKVINRFRRFSV